MEESSSGISWFCPCPSAPNGNDSSANWYQPATGSPTSSHERTQVNDQSEVGNDHRNEEQHQNNDVSFLASAGYVLLIVDQLLSHLFGIIHRQLSRFNLLND